VPTRHTHKWVGLHEEIDSIYSILCTLIYTRHYSLSIYLSVHGHQSTASYYPS
jgi:hypothetical protein